MQSEIDALRANYEEQLANAGKEMEATKAKHLEEQLANAGKEMEATKAKHLEEQKAARQELEDEQLAHLNATTVLKAQHKKEMDDLLLKMQQEIEKLRASYDATIAEKEQEMKNMKQAHLKQTNEMKKEMEDLLQAQITETTKIKI